MQESAVSHVIVARRRRSTKNCLLLLFAFFLCLDHYFGQRLLQQPVTMPIHFLSTALSSVIAFETLPVVLAAVFAIVFLKQWSAGLDLLSHLDRAASEPEKEIDDTKGGVLVKKRKIKPRDLHGTVVLVVVSLNLLENEME